MPVPVPDAHRRLLDEMVAKLRFPQDREYVMTHYAGVRAKMAEPSSRMIANLLENLDRMFQLLESNDSIPIAEQKLAVAAIKYYLLENDAVPELHGGDAGLVDDAMVAKAAAEALAPWLRALQ